MDIQFYTKNRGDCPVKEYILDLNLKEQSFIIKSIEDKLARRNLNDLLKAEIVKKFSGQNNLYEYIPGQHRIFFSIYQMFYLLLYAFRKKSNKTPMKEINKALNYKEDYEIRHNIN